MGSGPSRPRRGRGGKYVTVATIAAAPPNPLTKEQALRHHSAIERRLQWQGVVANQMIRFGGVGLDETTWSSRHGPAIDVLDRKDTSRWSVMPPWMNDPLEHFRGGSGFMNTFLARNTWEERNMTAREILTLNESMSTKHHIVITVHDKRVDLVRVIHNIVFNVFPESAMTEIFVKEQLMLNKIGTALDLTESYFNNLTSFTRNAMDERKYSYTDSTRYCDVIVCYNGNVPVAGGMGTVATRPLVRDGTNRKKDGKLYINPFPLTVVDIYIGPRGTPTAPIVGAVGLGGAIAPAAPPPPIPASSDYT